jgi:hypothetical protein
MASSLDGTFDFIVAAAATTAKHSSSLEMPCLLVLFLRTLLHFLPNGRISSFLRYEIPSSARRYCSVTDSRDLTLIALPNFAEPFRPTTDAKSDQTS